MPSSAVRTFTDPDAYHAAIQNAEVQAARGQYRTELTLIRLHRLWMLPIRDITKSRRVPSIPFWQKH
jgi:hypothetical protein